MNKKWTTLTLAVNGEMVKREARLLDSSSYRERFKLSFDRPSLANFFVKRMLPPIPTIPFE